MYRSLRRVGVLAVAGLALSPISSVHAMHLSDSAAALLRYHYVTGQSYAYRLSMAMQMSTSGSGSGASSALPGSVAMDGVLRYHILSVDAAGGATARVSTSNMTMSMPVNGQTVTSALPNQPATVIHLNADGSPGSSTDAGLTGYGMQAMVNLPSGAVAPGAHWSSVAVAGIPASLGASMAPMRMTDHNVLSKYMTSDGQRVAAIDSTGATEYATDSAVNGTPVHIHMSASVAGQSLFGTSLGRIVSSQQHLDMRMFMSSQTAAGDHAAIRAHMTMYIAMQPLGW